ncbi:MAG: preprotein translocase subunit YajC [Frankiaceae bacterium]
MRRCLFCQIGVPHITHEARVGGKGAVAVEAGALIFPLLLLLLVFFLVSTQRRRQRQIQTVQHQLVPGVRVMTTAGLFGTLKDVEDSEVLIEIAPGVVCRYARAAVAKVIPEGVVPKE